MPALETPSPLRAEFATWQYEYNELRRLRAGASVAPVAMTENSRLCRAQSQGI